MLASSSLRYSTCCGPSERGERTRCGESTRPLPPETDRSEGILRTTQREASVGEVLHEVKGHRVHSRGVRTGRCGVTSSPIATPNPGNREVPMGILDDLLSGLAGQAPARQQQTRVPGGGGGMSQVLMALMPVVLQMLSNRGTGGGSGSGGGLTDVLGQVLGGGGRGAAGGLGGLGGGLGGLLEQMQRAGFSEEANSWVSRGENKPISPDAMSQVFGDDGLEQISRQAGIRPDEASRGLSALLPEVVDRMTPDGKVPDADALAKSVDDFVRRLGS